MGWWIPLLAVGTGLEVYGQLQAGKEAERAAGFNALQARRERELNRMRVARQIKEREKETKELISSQTAAAAGAGVTQAGSIALLKQEAEAIKEYEIEILKREGTLVSENLKAEERELLRRGKRAKKASKINALASILSAGAVASRGE